MAIQILEDFPVTTVTSNTPSNLSDSLANFYNRLGLAWWVEIKTDRPACTYFFGPFLSQKEADTAAIGYRKDLENEHAEGIALVLKRCKPTQLTICDEPEGSLG